ncbi:hypothetical protein P0D73_00825 [Paraburkholderia sp. RL18-101-BIB-B]|uniref:hypothetical protein n=1 Tax=Paraburkholderia sp. RL18-101-BIB-B TaxID=3031634 RepID=UPI0038BCD1FA
MEIAYCASRMDATPAKMRIGVGTVVRAASDLLRSVDVDSRIASGLRLFELLSIADYRRETGWSHHHVIAPHATPPNGNTTNAHNTSLTLIVE